MAHARTTESKKQNNEPKTNQISSGENGKWKMAIAASALANGNKKLIKTKELKYIEKCL